jgi:hypothetical protein
MIYDGGPTADPTVVREKGGARGRGRGSAEAGSAYDFGGEGRGGERRRMMTVQGEGKARGSRCTCTFGSWSGADSFFLSGQMQRYGGAQASRSWTR